MMWPRSEAEAIKVPYGLQAIAAISPLVWASMVSVMLLSMTIDELVEIKLTKILDLQRSLIWARQTYNFAGRLLSLRKRNKTLWIVGSIQLLK